MIPNQDSMTIGDKVAAAAKSEMKSIVETARHSGTKVIVLRNGQIEQLSRNELPELPFDPASTESKAFSDSK